MAQQLCFTHREVTHIRAHLGWLASAAILSVAATSLPLEVSALQIGNRVMAATGGANVRNQSLASVLFTKTGGVHGSIFGEPNVATTGGYIGIIFNSIVLSFSKFDILAR